MRHKHEALFAELFNIDNNGELGLHALLANNLTRQHAHDAELTSAWYL